MFNKILLYTKKDSWDWFQVLLFFISLQFCTKANVIAGLIVWLTLVCISLGITSIDKVIKANV